MNIKTCPKAPARTYPENPMFGTEFVPYVLKMHLNLKGPNDYNAEIIPFADEPFSPGASVLHYGQSIFEGLKAFAQPNGDVGIFRLEQHAARFRKSAQRMMMADVPEQVFIDAVKAFVARAKDDVPKYPEHSLYLRPLLIAADQKIKVGSSSTYIFYVMGTIAGNYFGSGGKVKPARVLVSPQFVRAHPGGLGETKTAANYAASIYPQSLGAQKGCDQVLFLDSVHHDFIDELGGMNFFAIRGNELLTPDLNGCILRGVTRASIIEMAPKLGFKVSEGRISFTELRKMIEKGDVTETFACGTAAVVSPIGEFLFQKNIGDEGTMITLKGTPEKSMTIRKALIATQEGKIPSPANWLTLL
jgi:branched-chain amino acid aminotransferase